MLGRVLNWSESLQVFFHWSVILFCLAAEGLIVILLTFLTSPPSLMPPSIFCISQELHFHQVVSLSYLFLKVWVCIVIFYAPIARHWGIMFTHVCTVCTSHIGFLLWSSLKEVILNLCKMKPSLISNLFTLVGSGGIYVLWAHSSIIYVALNSTIIILHYQYDVYTTIHLNITMIPHLDVPNLQYQLIQIHAIMLWCPYKQLINTFEFINVFDAHMIHISVIFPHPFILTFMIF